MGRPPLLPPWCQGHPVLFYLVDHLREKWFRVRPHTEVLQLKLDSHSCHLNFFICERPKDGAQTVQASRELARASSVAGCGRSPLPSSGADLGSRGMCVGEGSLHEGSDLGRSGLSSGFATEQPPGPALSLSVLPLWKPLGP